MFPFCRWNWYSKRMMNLSKTIHFLRGRIGLNFVSFWLQSQCLTVYIMTVNWNFLDPGEQYELFEEIIKFLLGYTTWTLLRNWMYISWWFHYDWENRFSSPGSLDKYLLNILCILSLVLDAGMRGQDKLWGWIRHIALKDFYFNKKIIGNLKYRNLVPAYCVSVNVCCLPSPFG